MSQILADTLPHIAVPAAAITPATDRRRPGRMEHASPELIKLMRKPDRAARLRVALYDAPGFVLPTQHQRPALSARTAWQMAGATVACSAVCAAVFEGMLVIWG